MFRRSQSLLGLIGLVGLTALAACSDVSAPNQNGRIGAASRSGSGSGGGGGGTTTTPTPASCAYITTFSNTTGYYKVNAAIWTQFAYTNTCGYAVAFTMNYVNGNTGLVDFSRSATLMPSGTIDFDWAPFSTPYTVTMTLTDPAGTVMDFRSAAVMTKAAKSPGA